MSPSKHRMVRSSKPCSSAASMSIPSTPSNSIVSVTASRSQGPRMTASMRMCLRTASGPTCRASASSASPSLSSSSSGNGRVSTRTKVERLRLANRLRDQLWRYYPQMLQLGDLDKDWMLDLWEAAPTPEKASRASKAAIARVLKKYRIRRFDVAQVLGELRKPALSVAQGTIEAATAHIRVGIERLRLVNRQLADAELRLDQLCKKLAEPVAGDDGENVPGQRQEHRDVTILDSLPGVGRVVLATMLAESPDALQRRDYHALRTLCGTAPVTRRSGKSCIVTRRH